MADCLTPAQIEGLLALTLLPPEQLRAEEHAAICETCRGRIEARRAEENLFGQIKEAGHDETLLQPASPGGAAQPTLPAADLIEGYEVLREIGRGGMGIIYEAIQLKLNRRVALKVLPAIGGAADQPAIVRFRREATAAAKLHHTNIVPIYDFGQSGKRYYYAMELVEGQSLTEMVRRFAAGNAPVASITRLEEMVRGNQDVSSDADDDSSSGSGLSSGSRFGSHGSHRKRAYYRHVAQWIADAADALHYAHSQGIIHRDIKPANLMLCTDGRIMVLDFGLAKSSSEMSATMTGSLLGTLRYMSPEQAMAKRMKVDHRTDVYSLGATLYELLAFQPAFRGTDEKETLGMIITRDPTPPRKIVPEVPGELQTICLKTLEKDADARYTAAKELADDLRRFVQDVPILAKPVGPIGRTIKFVRRRRAVTVAACSLFLLTAAAIFGVHEHRERQNKQRELENTQVADWLNRGSVHFKAREWAGADDAYQQVLKRDPANFSALYGLVGVIRYRYGDPIPPDAFQRYDALVERASRLNPQNAKVWNARGIYLRLSGRVDEAIVAHSKGLAVDPLDYQNLTSLANAYAQNDDLTKALECLRKAISTKDATTDTMPWYNLAAVECQLGEQHYALEIIDRALAIKRDDVLSLLLKAQILMDSADASARASGVGVAITAYNLAGPNSMSGRESRIQALAQLRIEHWNEANLAAQRALELKDSSPWPQLVLAIAGARLGHEKEARDHLDAARHAQYPKFVKRTRFVSAEGGLLWFETKVELDRLRAEAERLLSPVP